MEKKNVLPNQSGRVSSYSLHGPAGFGLTFILLILVLLSTLVVQPALAGGGGANLYVATTGVDSGNCLVNPCRTIGYAMDQASSYDNIHIAAGTYVENLTPNKNLDFYGAGMNATILDGGDLNAVIYNISYNLIIMDLTIQNGRNAGGSGGGIAHWGGTLNLIRVKVTGNAANTGGGIFSAGELSMTDCIVSTNNAETATIAGYGGGLFLQGSGVNATLVNVSISGNTATGSSGGLHNQSTGTVNLTNVTISGNMANTNGAISNTNSSTLNLVNSTIADNFFSTGGTNGGIGNYATMNFKNTIVAENAGSNCFNGSGGTLNTLGNNLESANTCGFNHPSDYRNTDPLLGPLTANGGITYTRALLAGSPAIDSGTNVGCTSKDQRGMPRPKDGNFNGVATCDIGAYEFPDSTFGDVPTTHSAWSFIERLYAAGITSGCGSGNYCPLSEVNRAQMAIFLLRGMHGGSYTPPAVGGSTGFGDVPLDATYAPWVKQLAAEGITAGCGGGNFCPLQIVNRAQMAIFLLRAKHGAAYTPPAVGASTGFGDVPLDATYAPWVKQLAAEEITAGCGGGNFCPLQNVNRAQMAIFLVRTFSLP